MFLKVLRLYWLCSRSSIFYIIINIWYTVSHNIHGLIHVVQDVRKFGILDCFSAFKYENYLQRFKRVLKKHDKPLEQTVRRCIKYEQNKNNRISTEKPEIIDSYFSIDFKSIHIKGTLIGHCYDPQYKIMWCSNTTICTDTLADNCSGLIDGNIVEVKNIVYWRKLNTNVIIGNEFCHRKDSYNIPCPSSLTGIFIVENLDSELKIWPIENIKTKYVKLPVEDNKFAIFPLH